MKRVDSAELCQQFRLDHDGVYFTRYNDGTLRLSVVSGGCGCCAVDADYIGLSAVRERVAALLEEIDEYRTELWNLSVSLMDLPGQGGGSA
jgi:hypothetical protein